MPRYIAFYKPYEVLSSFTDPEGRPALAAYVPAPGVYAAGRLDYDSEGLLLLTDDGDLAHRLTDPYFHHPRTYYVQVEGIPADRVLDPIRRGMIVRGRQTQPAEVEIIPEPDLPPRPKPVRAYHPTTWLKVVLHEGKKRQLRRMTAAVGFPTLRLVRVAIGDLSVWGLQPGAWRDLTDREVRQLKYAVGMRG
ncbi:MAG TPA: pseudouridine synthase [Anaerolineae bacterium]|nr:pseudouridine synthase [Anaerolineae bacterium]